MTALCYQRTLGSFKVKPSWLSFDASHLLRKIRYLIFHNHTFRQFEISCKNCDSQQWELLCRVDLQWLTDQLIGLSCEESTKRSHFHRIENMNVYVKVCPKRECFTACVTKRNIFSHIHHNRRAECAFRGAPSESAYKNVFISLSIIWLNYLCLLWQPRKVNTLHFRCT